MEETKFALWTKRHRFTWCSILVLLGMGAGMFIVLFGSPLKNGLGWGAMYSTLFLITEFQSDK
jgi:hypothetical protein